MIYFDAPTQRQVLERLHAAMLPDGLLYVGHSGELHASARVVPPARQDRLLESLSMQPSAFASAPAPFAPHSARLDQLRAAPRSPSEASFFYWDSNFKNDAVKVLPGEFFVSDEDMLIVTTLGSCIAACLWDRERRIGGMNHFMLPEGTTAPGATAPMRWNC